MPVLPQFEPETQSTGVMGGQLLAGEEAGESLMDRAQARQIAQQKADQERMEFQAKWPVIQATAVAQVAGANASIENSARMEKLRAQAAAESPGFNNEFLDAMTLAGWNERADALAALQPKISYMALFPEYKGFVDTVNNARVQAHGSAIADLNMEKALEVAQTNFDRGLAVAGINAGARTEAEKTKAEAGIAKANIYTTAKTEQQRIANDTKLTLQERNAQLQANKSATQIRGLMDAADQANQAAAEATAAGDEETAKFHRQAAAMYLGAAQKAATYSGDKPPVAAETSPSVRRPVMPNRPSVKDVQATPAPEISVNIPGSGLAPSNQGRSAVGEAVIPQASPVMVSQPAQPAQPAAQPAAPVEQPAATAAQPPPSVQPAAPAPQQVTGSTIRVKPNTHFIIVEGKHYPVATDKNGVQAYFKDGRWVELQTEK